MGEELLFIVTIVGGAAAIPFLSRKLKAPSSIVEIIFGIVLFSLIFQHQPEWFRLFKEFGLIYLMFIAGMELDVRLMLRQVHLLWYLGIVMVSFVVMPVVFVNLGLPFYLGIVVSLISGGVVVPVLRETGFMRSPLGRDALTLTLSGEFISIIMLTALDIHQRYGTALQTVVSVIKVVVLFSLAVLFLKVLYLMAWWWPEKVKSVMESEDPVEEGIRAIIFVAFAGALFAYWAGVEPILGSFMAGAIFSYVFKSKGRFEEKINAVGFGFFIPIFFIGIGANFDVRLLYSASSMGLAMFIALMVYAGNLPVLLTPMFMKTGIKEATAISLLLSSPLSLMIVAATLGVKSGLLDESYFGPVVIASMASSLMYPWMFRMLAGKMQAPEEKTS